MVRLVLFLGVALVACCAFVLPGAWDPIAVLGAGPITYTGPLHGGDATVGPVLPVPLVSQYQGLATDNVNCGPAAVAAIVRYARPDLATMGNLILIAQVRDGTGEPDGDTDTPGLARALAAFGVPSAPLYARDTANGTGDPLAAIRLALSHGRPVLALVSGAALGRGDAYGNHFVVITGMDPRTGSVDVVDPDTQAPRSVEWQPGGQQRWSAALARAALSGVGDMDALVAGATRSFAAAPDALRFVRPAELFLLVAGVMSLLAVVSHHRRGRDRRRANVAA